MRLRRADGSRAAAGRSGVPRGVRRGKSRQSLLLQRGDTAPVLLSALSETAVGFSSYRPAWVCARWL